MTLIIVESPTKARTITKFLGSGYVVRASMGHIRDLPKNAAEIPAKYKSESWARLGIDTAHDFKPLYVVDALKKKTVKELKSLIEKEKDVILATDEDREGEAISWHLAEVLGLKNPKRMVFHEITKSAIQDALDHPRTIDMNLVQAQEARRILDRLVGYTVSPLLWKKIKFGLSAGRVQSVAMRLIVNREQERLIFKKAGYQSIEAMFKADASTFASQLYQIGTQKTATGKDFDDKGQLIDPSLLILDSINAPVHIEGIKKSNFAVDAVEKSEVKRNPQAPYITSSLQIDANRKLGFSSKYTMQVAQKLYEKGFITYMRTDSVTLSEQALQGAKQKIIELYGESYWAGYYRTYKSKSKNAQEAHEAIRPAGSHFPQASELGLEPEEYKLYDLIWKRTIASQMKEATLDQTTVLISSSPPVTLSSSKDDISKYFFRTTGTAIKIDGFLRVYQITSIEDGEDESSQMIPTLTKGEKLAVQTVASDIHETKPPARFNEASLVKKLETEGIGRPSTYASIISTIQARGYIRKVSNQLVPTFAGFAVTNLLEKHFPSLVDLAFTAKMEESLDEIEAGTTKWVPYLTNFFLGRDGLEQRVKVEGDSIDPKEISTVRLPAVSGENPIRYGKFGAYVDFGEVKATIPDEIDIQDITQTYLETLKTSKQVSEDVFCEDGEGNPVYIKTGKYGPYLAVGTPDKSPTPKKSVKSKSKTAEDLSPAKSKIRFISIPAEIGVANVTPEIALRLISLPRILGRDPDGNEIKANYGKYGPYVQKDKLYASIPKGEDLFAVTLDRALELIKEKESKPKREFRRFKKVG
ncbi:MAG: type I DNA topoisomerase [bacterium]